MPRKITCCIAALVCALAVAACGSSGDDDKPANTAAKPAQAQGADALYAEAKKAGSITLYGPFQSTFKPLYDAFTKQYPGVTVKTVDIFGPPLTARLQGEFATGKVKADLLATGPVDLGLYGTKGWLAPFKPEGVDQLDAKYVGPENQYVEPLLTQTAMFYNAKALQSDGLPKTWKDLLDAKWKGKLALPDPALPGLSSQALAAAQKAGVIDEAGLKTLNANATKFAAVPAAIQSVATGQKQIGLLAAFQLVHLASEQGAPIKFFLLDDGTPATGLGYAVLSKAKNPAGAKLLIQWLLTTAAQKGISGLSLQGTVPDAPPPAGGMPELSTITTLSMDLAPADLAAAQKTMTTIFGGGG